MRKKTVKTIEDIARLANVSKATVSRSLNDSPLVKKETKEHIQAIAKEHHFSINAPARNLSLRQSHTIAFVTYAYHKDSFSAEFMFGLEMMSGITKGLYSLGYELLIVHVDPYETGWAQRYLDSGRVDGFILMTSFWQKRHINILIEMEAPFIIWGVSQQDQNFCTVTGDDVTGGRLATEHLINTGKQQIAFLGGPKMEPASKDRFKGYKSALSSVGRGVEQDLLSYGDYSFESGSRAMEHLLSQSPDLDAVVICSDLMAMSAINVIQENGKRVPEDIAVVGYDDLSIAAFTNLPLTTIRQNVPLAGRLLAQNLIQNIKSGVVTNVTVPVELVVRKSA